MSDKPDLLAQFRRKPAVQSEAVPPPRSNAAQQKADDYAAFAGKDKVERLRIRRAKPITRAAGYQYLLDVVSDGDNGTEIVLVYTYMIVLIKGRNLQKAVLALEIGTADFLQEFDPKRWEKPAPDIAIIDSIEVVIKAGSEAVAASEKGK